MPMNPLQNDLEAFSEESSDDEENYTIMTPPVKENMSSSLSKSSDCVYESTLIGESDEIIKRLHKSMSGHMQVTALSIAFPLYCNLRKLILLMLN